MDLKMSHIQCSSQAVHCKDDISDLKEAVRLLIDHQNQTFATNARTQQILDTLEKTVSDGFGHGRVKMDTLAADIKTLHTTITKAEGSIGATRWIGAAVITGFGLLLTWFGVQK